MRPVICMITPSAHPGADGEQALIDRVGAAARAGAHLIQIRQPQLEGRPLARLVERSVQAAKGTAARILVNDRVDVALTAGAHGVHLRGDSMPAARVRAIAPPGFLIGRSVHAPGDGAQAAQDGTLDYLIFGTVFMSRWRVPARRGLPPSGCSRMAHSTRCRWSSSRRVRRLTPLNAFPNMRTRMAMVEHARPDFGMKIKRLREERGVSLRQIADTTKISIGVFEALERNDISRLPGGIFSRAFVRSYAIEVGLDPEQTVRDFLLQFPHDSVTDGSPHAPQPGHAPRTRRRGRTVAIVALVAISVLIGVILFFALTSRQ